MGIVGRDGERAFTLQPINDQLVIVNWWSSHRLSQSRLAGAGLNPRKNWGESPFLRGERSWWLRDLNSLARSSLLTGGFDRSGLALLL